MSSDRKTRILATAYDYRPGLGGVATCAFKTMQALSRIPDVELRCLARATPGATEFDFHGHFETHRLALNSRASLAIPALATHLSRHLITYQPQAILNFHWLPCGAASLLALPLRAPLHIPYFVFAHGNEIMETGRTPYKRLRQQLAPVKRNIFRGAAAVFAVSNYTARLVQTECGVAPENIEVVFNGVDGSAFYPEPPQAGLLEKYRLQGKRVLVTVCRLDDYKGIDRTLAALPLVLERFPNTAYLVCGEGPDRQRLEALSRHHGVHEHVVFTGAVPPDKLRDYYNLADCFIMPSRLDESAPNVEGFGIVFLEAAACEKPVIAGNSGGIPDAVEDGRSGWLVDAHGGAEQAIARAVLECFSDTRKAKAFGKYGRMRALETFTWENSARKIWERINRHVRHRGPGA